MKKFILASLMLLPAFTSLAQFELNAPFMSNVPQAYYANPTLMPEYKVIIGLPFAASTYGSYRNTGLSLGSFVVKGTDANKTLASLGAGMPKRNYVAGTASTDLFFLRIKAKNSFLSLNITEHFTSRIGYSRDFIRLFAEGNMPEQNPFKDNTVSLNGTSLDLMHFREVSLGYTRQMDKLTIGGRARALFGLANLQTRSMEGGIKTDPDNAYALTGNFDFRVNSSFNSRFYGKNEDGSNYTPSYELAQEYFLNTKNLGVALDAGASYKLLEKLTLTAVVRDMGFINWRSHVQNFSGDGEVQFTGVPISGGMNMGEYVDSLTSKLNFTTSKEAYRTYLNGQANFLAQYQLARNTKVGGGLFMELNRGVYPALTANIQQRLGRFMNLQVNYSIQNRTYNNLGAGVAIKLLPLQLYIMSDNLTVFMRPLDTRSLNVRMGANYVFGNTLKAKKKPKQIVE